MVVIIPGIQRVLEGHTYSNWISNVDEIKGIRGYEFTLGGDVVS